MIKITKKDIFWSYAGNIINVGMNFFVLPFVLRMLNAEEIGMWYIFISIASLIALFDFGFSPTILRNISYAWSGASELQTEGAPLTCDAGSPNYNLVINLLHASKRIYLLLSLVAGFLLILLGTPYILSIIKSETTKYLIAWGVYLTAVFINLYYSYWSPMLRGIGEIKTYNQIQIESKVVYVVLSIIGLLLGGGLIWISIMYLVSGLILRILSKHYFLKTSNIKNYFVRYSELDKVTSVLKLIWPNSRKLGLVIAGSWMISRANIIICSSYFGLISVAQFGLSLQLINGVTLFSTILLDSYTPEIASSIASNNKVRMMQLFSRTILMQWTVGFLGYLAIIFLGPFLLDMIGSNSILLPKTILVILCIVSFIDNNSSMFIELTALTNRVPFVAASLLTGIGIIVLSLFFVNFTNLGILGLVLSQGLAQLLYNNWHWPRMVCKEYNTSIFKIFKAGLHEYFDFIKKVIK